MPLPRPSIQSHACLSHAQLPAVQPQLVGEICVRFGGWAKLALVDEVLGKQQGWEKQSIMANTTAATRGNSHVKLGKGVFDLEGVAAANATRKEQSSPIHAYQCLVIYCGVTVTRFGGRQKRTSEGGGEVASGL